MKGFAMYERMIIPENVSDSEIGRMSCKILYGSIPDWLSRAVRWNRLYRILLREGILLKGDGTFIIRMDDKCSRRIKESAGVLVVEIPNGSHSEISRLCIDILVTDIPDWLLKAVNWASAYKSLISYGLLTVSEDEVRLKVEV